MAASRLVKRLKFDNLLSVCRAFLSVYYVKIYVYVKFGF